MILKEKQYPMTGGVLYSNARASKNKNILNYKE